MGRDPAIADDANGDDDDDDDDLLVLEGNDGHVTGTGGVERGAHANEESDEDDEEMLVLQENAAVDAPAPDTGAAGTPSDGEDDELLVLEANDAVNGGETGGGEEKSCAEAQQPQLQQVEGRIEVEAKAKMEPLQESEADLARAARALACRLCYGDRNVNPPVDAGCARSRACTRGGLCGLRRQRLRRHAVALRDELDHTLWRVLHKAGARAHHRRRRRWHLLRVDTPRVLRRRLRCSLRTDAPTAVHARECASTAPPCHDECL